MEISAVMPFLEANKQGVLATHRKSGRPQLSNIVYGVLDGVIGVSVTADRAKTKNMRRDPRATLHVSSDDFWSWVAVDTEVELGPIAAAPGDPATDALRYLYRHVNREHPDWDEFDEAMVNDRRLVALLRPVHAYGQRV